MELDRYLEHRNHSYDSDLEIIHLHPSWLWKAHFDSMLRLLICVHLSRQHLFEIFHSTRHWMQADSWQSINHGFISQSSTWRKSNWLKGSWRKGGGKNVHQAHWPKEKSETDVVQSQSRLPGGGSTCTLEGSCHRAVACSCEASLLIKRTIKHHPLGDGSHRKPGSLRLKSSDLLCLWRVAGQEHYHTGELKLADPVKERSAG